MNFVAEIKNKLDIVEFIKGDGVELRPESSSSFSGLCPFHTEKTPSFKVSETFQNYKCFGCGEYGDVISFFAKRNVLDYYSASLLLAEKLGIKVDSNKKGDNLKRLFEMNKCLEDFYKSEFGLLADYHPAKTQITSRGLMIDSDYFGYAPSDSNKMVEYMKSKGFSVEELKGLGHITEKGGPQLRDRLVFFIRNYMGNTIGFSGRTLSNQDGFKYVNSKSSKVFNKSVALFNIDKAKEYARKEKYIFLVEGQFDVVAMIQNGYKNTIAISGTAFTELHEKEINRCIGEDGKIILLMDGDEAGERAVLKIFKEHPNLQSRLYIIRLSDLDPCDYLKENKKLPKAKLFLSELYLDIRKRFPTDILENRQLFLKAVQTEMTDFIKDAQLKEQYLRSACILSGFEFDNLKIKKEKQKDKKVEKEEKQKLNKEDEYFLSSIGFYLVNKEFFDNELNKLDYPEKYSKFLDEINSGCKLVPENFSQPKILEVISKMNIEKMPNARVALSHYNSLIKYGKDAEKRKKNHIETTNIINNISGLKIDDVIKVLESL